MEHIPPPRNISIQHATHHLSALAERMRQDTEALLTAFESRERSCDDGMFEVNLPIQDRDYVQLVDEIFGPCIPPSARWHLHGRYRPIFVARTLPTHPFIPILRLVVTMEEAPPIHILRKEMQRVVDEVKSRMVSIGHGWKPVPECPFRPKEGGLCFEWEHYHKKSAPLSDAGYRLLLSLCPKLRAIVHNVRPWKREKDDLGFGYILCLHPDDVDSFRDLFGPIVG